MRSRTVDKLEALGLVVGPLLALFFFALEPGAMFVDRADPNDHEAVITALASNGFLAHVTALLVPAGLLLLLYGLSGVNRVIQDDRMAASLARLGILAMTIGAIGWILTSGLNHVLAATDVGSAEALRSAVSVRQADSGITVASGVVVAVGFAAFAAGLSVMFPPGFNRTAARLVVVISLIALIAMIIGQTASSSAMVSVARACYVPWAVWSAILGAGFLKGTGLPTEG